MDLVLFPGDAYKTRHPSSTYQYEFVRRIKRLAAGKVRSCDRWSPAQGSGEQPGVRDRWLGSHDEHQWLNQGASHYLKRYPLFH